MEPASGFIGKSKSNAGRTNTPTIRGGLTMKWYTVVKQIEGIPYKVGQRIPLYRGRFNQLIWHVWTTMIEVPEDCVREATA